MVDLDALDSLLTQFGPERGAARGKWFGKPCIKARDRVLVVLWGRDLAFKLEGLARAEALQVPGAHLFDPRGKGSPMKEWVQIPANQSSAWPRFANLAYEYLATLPS